MEKKYTSNHEWIEASADEGVFRVGITDYAQEQLGDVVTVELPDIDREVSAGEECAVIESVKAASDIYSPIAGVIRSVNGQLSDDPGLINQDPEDSGWLFEVAGSIDAAVELLSEDEYKQQLD